MSDFLNSQLDYIYFFYGAAFLLLIPICLFLRGRMNRQMAWTWLGWFGATHGVNEWLDLLALSLGSGPGFDLARLGILAASFVLLAEFGRASLARMGARVPGRWILAIMVGLVGLGGFAGVPGLFAATRYVLGFGGGCWAAGALFLAGKRAPLGSRQLQAAALGMTGYALACGLVPNPAPFFPAAWLNHDSFLVVTSSPIQLWRGMLAVWITMSLCLLALACLDNDQDRQFRSWFRHLLLVTLMGVAILWIGGWSLTHYLGTVADRDLRADYEHNVNVLRQLILEKMKETDHLVKFLTESPEVSPVLTEKTLKPMAKVSSLLDRCSQTLEQSICYVMDTAGLTIASSNRDRPDSFVGNFYDFRPYFQQAVQGSPGRYWALGTTSKEMGYYASSAARDPAGKIIGVAVVKRTIDEIKKIFPGRSLGLIIDPHGIVVMANHPDLVLRSLWTIPWQIQKKLVDSRQFGDGPFTPILDRQPVDGRECLIKSKRLRVLRQPGFWQDWSIVSLEPMTPIIQGRLLGISATVVLNLVLLGFLTIATIMRDSEEGFRQLFENAVDILILHDKGRIAAVNQQACRHLGYTREELLGMSLFDVEVGINKEDLITLWEQGGELTTLAGVYRRRDGSTFPAEIRAGEISYRGQNLRLVAVRDVTERKRAEEALRQSQAGYRHLASQLMTVQEAERQRLARELHDDLTQRLAVLAMETQGLELQMAIIPPAAGAAKLKEIRENLVKLSMDIHAISRQLHPSILDDLGLADAIASECASFRQHYGIMVNYQSTDLPCAVPKEIAINVYRIAQEALRNVSRHARANSVDIALLGREDALHLTIKDNGQGFDTQGKKLAGLGLASMKERASLIGGDFSVQSWPGHGTVIQVTAPLWRTA